MSFNVLGISVVSFEIGKVVMSRKWRFFKDEKKEKRSGDEGLTYDEMT